jgi:methionyl-tRNA formyltransferase
LSPGPAVANVYCGTSEFAAAVLEVLAASPHRPTLVVTPPDRRRGRGRRTGSPPAADRARALGIELHQTESINLEESRAAVLAAEPEVATVCAFGQLIKRPLIDELPMLNVHPSLLPRWRGAAPIERAMMAGDELTGVCVMKLTEGLDSGPVGLREEVPIDSEDDFGSLSERLAAIGGRLLVEALTLHGAGELQLAPQPEEGVTYAEKIESAERRVDTGRPSASEALRIRALTPHVGAFVALATDGERLGVRSVVPVDDGPGPGEFATADGALLLGFASGALAIGEVQPAGGRWMAATDYVRGRGVPERAAPA